MDATDICYLSALELREGYRKRELSPVEVTEAVLDRISSVDSLLNAFVTVTDDLARQQAKRAEQAYQGSDPVPVLTGIPGSLKDLTVTSGIRTTRGSLLTSDWVPDFDAPVAERLAQAGMVLLGKTNTPESGWKGETTNRVAGSTHNPWKHGKTPGGSSGGAAAAVAAGLGPLAQGSDGAGSIRIPASFSGIFGHKPSFGLIPQYPPSAVQLISHLGPMSRTVRDAALMLDVMAGADLRDQLSISTHVDHLRSTETSVRGLRVGWSPNLGYAPVDPEVAGIVALAASRFSDLGCIVEDASPDIPDPWELVHVIWSTGMAAALGGRFEEVRDQLDPGLVKVIEQGQGFTGYDVARAGVERNNYYHAMREFMSDYDLLLTPTMPITAFDTGLDFPPDVAGQPTTYLGWTPFTYPFDVTGQPAASVPCGFTEDGMPVGLQIVGRWRDDATVLSAAAAFEAMAPWADRRPDLEREASGE